MRSPEEYLHENSLQECVLYYPGAGTDTQPLELFARHPQLTRVIYSDYLVGGEGRRQEVVELFVSLRPIAAPVELSPSDFNCKNWADFWYDDSLSREFAEPDHAFGLECTLQRPFRKLPIRFDYLATEGIGTFSVLLAAGITPNIVVLQDHGTGGNWTGATDFGWKHIYALANQNNALPELLLVADNTGAWPEYERVSNDVFECGDAKHDRALYRYMGLKKR